VFRVVWCIAYVLLQYKRSAEGIEHTWSRPEVPVFAQRARASRQEGGCQMRKKVRGGVAWYRMRCRRESDQV